MRSLGISLAFALFLVVLIPVAESGQKDGLADRVAELEAQVAAMEEILQFVYVETEEINNLAGPHWIIEGVNVHVRSGSGTTDDGCRFVHPPCESLTGLGNVIVGYNEPSLRVQPERTGSHNLVLGELHSYSSFGGFVAGRFNTVSGPYASVSGGVLNEASGFESSVSGGSGNEASGSSSSVSGGSSNRASGARSSVSGGRGREAPDRHNWAAGSLFEEN